MKQNIERTKEMLGEFLAKELKIFPAEFCRRKDQSKENYLYLLARCIYWKGYKDGKTKK